MLKRGGDLAEGVPTLTQHMNRTQRRLFAVVRFRVTFMLRQTILESNIAAAFSRRQFMVRGIAGALANRHALPLRHGRHDV